MPECFTCSKPVGHDSAALGFLDASGHDIAYCTEHRKCLSCGMSLSPKDLEFCYNHNLPTKHQRCLIADDGFKPPAESLRETDFNKFLAVMNWVASMSNTVTLVTDMTFDQRYKLQNDAVAFATNLSVVLSKDKKYFQDRLNEQAREQELDRKQKRDKPAAIKKAAAVGIAAPTEKIARQKLTARDKAIQGLMKFMTREAAEAMVDSKPTAN